MKWPIATLAAVVFVSVIVAADDDAKAEMQKLEGAWKVVSFEAGGMKVDPGKGAPEKIVIKNGKATFFAGGKEIPHLREVRLDLDPKAKPKAINLVRGENETLPCIYEVTANELKLGMPMAREKGDPGAPAPRPKSFDTKDKPFVVLTTERIKN
jgi:uncharacterized protein (TIGR03067 family)